MNPWGLNDLDHKGNGTINRSYGGKKEERKEGKVGMGCSHCARK